MSGLPAGPFAPAGLCGLLSGGRLSGDRAVRFQRSALSLLPAAVGGRRPDVHHGDGRHRRGHQRYLRLLAVRKRRVCAGAGRLDAFYGPHLRGAAFHSESADRAPRRAGPARRRPGGRNRPRLPEHLLRCCEAGLNLWIFPKARPPRNWGGLPARFGEKWLRCDRRSAKATPTASAACAAQRCKKTGRTRCTLASGLSPSLSARSGWSSEAAAALCWRRLSRKKGSATWGSASWGSLWLSD